MTRLLVAAALALVACGAPEPPRYISIDSEFSEAERETIRAAVYDWCASDARWCPEEIGWAERGRFELVDDLPEDDYTRRVCPADKTCTTSGHNDGDNVRIARNRPSLGLDALWLIAAHEAGHFCKDGHTKHGLMAAAHKPADVLEVDDEAVRAWKAGCQ